MKHALFHCSSQQLFVLQLRFYNMEMRLHSKYSLRSQNIFSAKAIGVLNLLVLACSWKLTTGVNIQVLLLESTDTEEGEQSLLVKL